MNLLLLSNSRTPGLPYLSHALPVIAETIGTRREVCFVPFASVTASWDDFLHLVQGALASLGLTIRGAHQGARPEDAEVLMVGGGNTFHLLKCCRDRGLLEPLREAARGGTPYIGWSAGANLACPTIRTTNDMPIVEPGSLDALGLVPFQVNPHFTNELPPGHQGETREQRLAEFLMANPAMQVLGLPEGDWVRWSGTGATLGGPRPAVWMRAGYPMEAVPPGPLPAELTG
jgi:dipeptidase E